MAWQGMGMVQHYAGRTSPNEKTQPRPYVESRLGACGGAVVVCACERVAMWENG